jgi:hypothetical protein
MQPCKRPDCDKEFQPRGKKAYCSEECVRLDYNARRRKPLATKTCRHCGKEFKTSNKVQAYCPGGRCKLDHEQESRKLNVQNECRQCGKDFTITATNKVYCPECIGKVDPILEKKTISERKRREKEVAEILKEESERLQVIEVICAEQQKLGYREPKKLIKPIPKDHKFPDEHAELLASDWHVGELVRLEETAGIAEFNYNIFCKRLDRLAQSVYEIISIQSKSYNVPVLDLWFLGDIIGGENAYAGQHAYLDLFTADQLILGKDKAAEFIVNLLDVFDKIVVRGVVGNHGPIVRQGGKPVGPTWNNFDFLFYHMLRDRLRNYPQIQWEIPRSPFFIDDVLGWKFLAQHGEDVRMYQGQTPWYGLDRDVAKMRDMLHSIEQDFYYALYAHFHTEEQAELTRGERLMNGSVMGGSLHGMRIRRVSRPSQSFFGLSKKKGITWRYNLYLD